MDRPRRIRLVVGLGLGLISLVVAVFGAPLLAMLIWPPPEVSGNMDSMMQSFSQAAQTAAVAHQVSFGSFLFAGVCFTYVLVDVAIWFIGPPELIAEDSK